VWAALLDIFDALSHVPTLSLPWIVLVAVFLPIVSQQRWIVA
jgi:hypothetical protein